MWLRAQHLHLRNDLLTMLAASFQQNSGSVSLRASEASAAVGIQYLSDQIRN